MIQHFFEITDVNVTQEKIPIFMPSQCDIMVMNFPIDVNSC